MAADRAAGAAAHRRAGGNALFDEAGCQKPKNRESAPGERMPAAYAAEAEAAPVRAPGEGDAHEVVAVRADAGDSAVLTCLRTHGCCVLLDAVPGEALAEARAAFAPFLQEVAQCWDTDADTLTLASWRRYGVTRVPRVNAGKKNVHFTPDSADGSASLHASLARLAAVGGFARLLSAHAGARMSLTESGVSLTRGRGAGMEWHADGGVGEATVLMSLEDVPAARGALGLVPGSHAFYDADACGEDGVARALGACSGRVVWNAYRAGCPVLFDARTLHAAADNTTDELRCVAWYIYNADEEQQEDEHALSDALRTIAVSDG